MQFSKRIAAIAPSATLEITARARALRASGLDILDMAAGEPDFDTPEFIKQAAIAALAAGQTKYTPVAGTVALRQAASRLAQRLYHVTFDLAQVTVGTGGKQVLFNALAALLNVGDEVVFAAPYWVSYPDMVRAAGATPVEVRVADAQLPQAADLARAFTPRTKVLLLNSPSNPTGATYNATQLQAIAALLRQHPQVFIISDDIYYGLVYDAPFVSLAHVAPDLLERLLLATGVSKTYAMTGWRIGLGFGPAALLAAMHALQGASTSGACSIAQAAAVAALDGPQDAALQMQKTFKERRDILVAALQSIPNLRLTPPQGAFYAFPDVRAWLSDALPSTQQLCAMLLEKTHLALVPGEAFGAPGYIRLSFACSNDHLREGVARLQRGLAMLTPSR